MTIRLYSKVADVAAIEVADEVVIGSARDINQLATALNKCGVPTNPIPVQTTPEN